MTNYDDQSDFQINKAVAEAQGRQTWCGEGRHGYYRKSNPHAVWAGLIDGGHHYKPFDYCNNPSDMWPIVVEHKISITWTGSYWVMCAPFSHSLNTSQSKDRPLRGADIVYLKMEAAK